MLCFLYSSTVYPLLLVLQDSLKKHLHFQYRLHNKKHLHIYQTSNIHIKIRHTMESPAPTEFFILTFRCFTFVSGSIFRHKNCPISRHRDQYICSAHFLQFFCIKNNVFFCAQRNTKNFSKLIIIWLDQKRMILQYIYQQIFGAPQRS